MDELLPGRVHSAATGPAAFHQDGVQQIQHGPAHQDPQQLSKLRVLYV